MVKVSNIDQSLNLELGGQGQAGFKEIMIAIAVMAGFTAFFWNGLVSLGTAWTRPEYSYGPMVPLITAYMTIREIHHRPIVRNQDSRWPGFVMLAFGLCLGLIGNIGEFPEVITYGFIIAIGGFVLVLTGFREGIRFWPGWLHLFFMLPLPSMVYWLISTKLQLISSWLGVEVISLMNIPVYLEGNVIDLGIYKLQVVEACNGLRYLFPLLSFGWLFAVLYNGPIWHRVVLFLSTVPITIFMNSFRIGVTGVLVSYFGIGQAEGFLHYFEGWFIFMACICILFCEALILRRFLTRQTSNKPMLDFDTEGILGPLAKVRAITATPALIAATLVLLVAGVGWQAIPKGHAATQIARSSFNTFPLKIGEWQGRSSRLDPLIERSLNADDYVLADYSKPDGSQNVYLFVAYYSSQRGSSYIHSPQVCIPGGGWEVSNWSQVSISPGKSGGQPFAVNRAIVDKGELRQLVYYWFDQRGRRLTNDYHSKIDTMWSGVVSGRTDGALVRLIVPLEKGQDPSQGDEVLRTFLDGTLPLLPKYLPGA